MVKNNKFKLLAGPCVIESEEYVMFLAEALKCITEKFDVDFYFKASWDKANRTKATNYRGPGLQEGLRILEKAKTELGVRIVTDIHLPEQAEAVARWPTSSRYPPFYVARPTCCMPQPRPDAPSTLRKASSPVMRR